jgi:hypothetical protein
MSTPVQKAFINIYGNASNSLSFGNNCQPGNTILAIGVCIYANIPTTLAQFPIADNKLNNYNSVAFFRNAGPLSCMAIWLATSIVAGTNTITMTDTGGITFMGIALWELPGTWAIDVSQSGLPPSGTTPGPWTLNALNTNHADFCVESICTNAAQGPFTTSAPWSIETLTPRTDGNGFAENLQSSAGSLTPTFSGADNNTAAMIMYAAGFKQTGPPAGGSSWVQGNRTLINKRGGWSEEDE